MIGLSHPDSDVVARIAKLIDDHRSRNVPLSIRELMQVAPVKPDFTMQYADRLDTHGWTPEQLAAAASLPGNIVILADPVVIRDKATSEPYPAVTPEMMRHRLPVYISHRYIIYPDQDAHDPGYWDQQLFTTIHRANQLIDAITSILNDRGFVTIADVLAVMYGRRAKPEDLIKREWPAPWTNCDSITLGWDRTDHFKVEHPEGAIPMMRRITFPKPKAVTMVDQVKTLLDLRREYKDAGDTAGVAQVKRALNSAYGTPAMQAAVPNRISSIMVLAAHHVDVRFFREDAITDDHDGAIICNNDRDEVIQTLSGIAEVLNEYGYITVGHATELITHVNAPNYKGLWPGIDPYYFGWTAEDGLFTVNVHDGNWYIAFPHPRPLCVTTQDHSTSADDDEFEFSPSEHISVVIDKNCTAPAQYIKDILDAIAPGRSVSICFS